MATVSRELAAGEVHASSPASQEVVPATLCKVAHVGPRAEAKSVPDSSGKLLAPKQMCLGSKGWISGGREEKGLGTE